MYLHLKKHWSIVVNNTFSTPQRKDKRGSKYTLIVNKNIAFQIRKFHMSTPSGLLWHLFQSYLSICKIDLILLIRLQPTNQSTTKCIEAAFGSNVCKPQEYMQPEHCRESVTVMKVLVFDWIKILFYSHDL